MTLCRPDILDEFRCLAGDCPDTCCAAWEIEPDPASEARLRALLAEGGEAAVHLAGALGEEGEPFRQREGACPLLDSCRLCKLHAERPLVCREYPAYHRDIGSRREVGVSLSCPETVRMLLNHPLPLSYTETPLDAFPDGYNDFDAEILPHVLRMRQRLLDAAADDSLPITARVGRILTLSAEIERDIRRRRIDRLAVSVEASPRGSRRPRRGVAERLGARLLSVCYGFEYLVPAHREELALAHRTLHARAVRSLYAERRAAFLAHLSGREHEYEKWLSHTLRRYFPDAAETRRPLAEAKRTAATLLVILELGMSRFVRTGSFTVEDQAEILRVFSREYEHSTENPSLLATALGNPLFSLGRFLSALAE